MEDLSKDIQRGMEVVTNEGTRLGKVAEVWFGTSVGGPGPSSEETCMEIRRGLLHRDALYIPCRVIAGLDGRTVELSVDEATVRDTPSWHRKPAWVE